ncbi:DUF6090 family protein [Allomuricauda sp. NBRC 101325]|uniref:DUF6090 family protein n=1 Tax=Allomuricauda sp. NBRC 101325 TaxID=1113758 RepID=UPI0024A323CA|nr:DUF6090 family protein [Muricauda sp. NBRC 101325]GLU45472.1 hypothetical protein Musp01_30960 [Muricauda sp. NBRC 101325]
MIKFFRKIRQRLLSENKFSKYLVYAIGEVILVVIGILIALQINNWNEKRKSQIVEDNFFEDVLLDLKKDQDRLEYYALFYTKRAEYLDTLLTYLRNPQKTMGIDKFQQYVEPLYYTATSTSYSTSFESAKASGIFNDIKAKDLLKELSQYYSDFALMANNFASITRYVENKFEPIMYNFPEGNMNQNTGNLVINEENTLAFYNKLASIKDNRNIPIDYEIILRTPRMENYIIGDMGRTSNAIGKIKARQEKLQVLTRKIEERD